MTRPSELKSAGWARYDRPRIVGNGADAELDRGLERMQAFFRSLPPDRYEPESNRYRRHARAVYLPWTDTLSWLPDIDDDEIGPVVDYDMQGYNSEFAGVRRQFPAIPAEVRQNPVVERLVCFDLEETMWLDGFSRTPLNVGVGCIMLAVGESDGEAVATPNILHQDGGAVSFTFIHLMVRNNVVGGVNSIAPPRCVGLLPDEIAPGLIESEFILEEPLDSFAVHNSQVSHYVSPIRRGGGPDRGERGVLLVAISPLVKQL